MTTPMTIEPHQLRREDPKAFKAMEDLAASEPAQILLKRGSDGASLQAAVADYIAQGVKSGLPPDRWMIASPTRWGLHLSTPLALFQTLGVANGARAKAAQALSDAGCSLWDPSWVFMDLQKTRSTYSYFSAHDLAYFALSGVDTPLRRLLLKLALNDPKSPQDLAQNILDAYDFGVDGSSKTAKGVLSASDKKAKALCSVLCACSAEVTQAARREGWGELAPLLTDAQERLAAKKHAPQELSPAALKKSLTPAQKLRLRSLSTVLSKCYLDAELIVSSLEASPWLKAQPAIACIGLGSSVSLLAQALSVGAVEAVEWMEKAGANIWLAAAQDGDSNAAHWAFMNLDGFAPGEDLSSIARMLLRGAWLDGAPEPKERCLTLAKEAVEEVRDENDYDDDDARDEIAKAESLLAALERLTLEELIAPQDGAALAPSAKTHRRSAL